MNKYKRYLCLNVIAVLLIGLLAACGSETSGETSESTQSDSPSKMRMYHGENGDIEIPAHPKRVVVLGHIYVGNLLKLGIKPVAVNE